MFFFSWIVGAYRKMDIANHGKVTRSGKKVKASTLAEGSTNIALKTRSGKKRKSASKSCKDHVDFDTLAAFHFHPQHLETKLWHKDFDRDSQTALFYQLDLGEDPKIVKSIRIRSGEVLPNTDEKKPSLVASIYLGCDADAMAVEHSLPFQNPVYVLQDLLKVLDHVGVFSQMQPDEIDGFELREAVDHLQTDAAAKIVWNLPTCKVDALKSRRKQRTGKRGRPVRRSTEGRPSDSGLMQAVIEMPQGGPLCAPIATDQAVAPLDEMESEVRLQEAGEFDSAGSYSFLPLAPECTSAAPAEMPSERQANQVENKDLANRVELIFHIDPESLLHPMSNLKCRVAQKSTFEPLMPRGFARVATESDCCSETSDAIITSIVKLSVPRIRRKKQTRCASGEILSSYNDTAKQGLEPAPSAAKTEAEGCAAEGVVVEHIPCAETMKSSVRLKRKRNRCTKRLDRLLMSPKLDSRREPVPFTFAGLDRFCKKGLRTAVNELLKNLQNISRWNRVFFSEHRNPGINVLLSKLDSQLHEERDRIYEDERNELIRRLSCTIGCTVSKLRNEMKKYSWR